jgi:hypothetical protein
MVLKILLVFVATTVTWIAAIRVFTVSASIQDDWIRDLYAKKEAAAARISEPKIVIIGGSGTHYGYTGEAITRATGIPTINLGVHAGLNGEYVLERAKKSLKAGDWAILALEPQLYYALGPSKVTAEQVLRNDLGYLLRTFNIVAAMRIVFGLSPVDLFQSMLNRSIPWNSPTGRGTTVSAWGDETLAVSSLSTPEMRRRVEESGTFGPDIFDSKNPPQHLRNFFAWAKTHDVRVVEGWVPMLMQPEYETDPWLAYFTALKELYIENGGLSLGTATDYFQPIDGIFDFELHDNEIGRSRASAVLARDICKIRSCPTGGQSTTISVGFTNHPQE